MSEHASAWKPLIDDWVARERLLRPDAPVRPESVRVRDSVELDDQAFVLVSYDVEYPWPESEDTPDEERTRNTAVLQAARVRQPWIERDATRAVVHLGTEQGEITVAEHVLGTRRAFSGHVFDGVERVTLHFEDGETADASVVDGWFLAVVADTLRVSEVEAHHPAEPYRGRLERRDYVSSAGLLDDLRSGGSGAGPEMYFSPRDLRAVQSLVRWERTGGVVVVATSLEQYDEGGILRLRIDGVRLDDDVFAEWPRVLLEAVTADGAARPLSSGRCGEQAHKDTLSLDVGFKPWLGRDVQGLTVVLQGLRGPAGRIDEVRLELPLRAAAE